jgi:hypothetical protein
VANDSTVAGYLQPVGTAPPQDADLDAIFQQMIVGLTGLPGNMVRPRWQPTVPKQPEPTANWCAVGVMDVEPDPYAYEEESADGTSTKQIRHEIIPVLCSFYGPHGRAFASQARDGIQLSQNNAMLDLHEMGLVEASRITPAPELVNQQWIRRFDLTMRIRRRIVRTYQVLSVLSAQATVEAETEIDTVTEHITVNQ